jgi:hypothetical protein
MASNSRTLTLALAADIDGLRDGLKQAEKAVDKSKDQIIDFGKKAALAFAAVGAAATAFAVSAVKAAAEDEKSRKNLEQVIRSSTKATEDQISAIDKYITKQSIATATTDDVLRPAFSRLIRSTQDVTKAQDLLTLAQEISIATGKPLESVTNALGRAYDGSNTALGKLGLGIDAATLRTQSFEETTNQLRQTYQGFIDNEATNAEFKFRQLTIAVDETKEQIGTALLPIVKELADYFLETAVPLIQAFAAGFSGEDGVTAGITEATEGAFEFGEQIRSTLEFVISIRKELAVLGAIIIGVFVASKIVAFVTAIMTLVTAMKALRTAAAGAAVATAFATGGTSVGAAAAALTAVAATYGLSQLAGGGDLGGAAVSNYAPSTGNFGGGGMGQITNITVNAIDGEGAARAVAKVVNQSAARSVPLFTGNGIRLQ